MSNEELVIKIKQNINPTENLEELYKNNLPFLRSICKNYTKFEEMEDLMQIAYVGIYEAVKRFEPEYGYKFMTYARWWIIREISTHISENSLVKIPQSKREEIIKYKKAVEFLTNEYKRLPTDEEIAYYMKISEDNAKQLCTLTKRIESLDEPLSGENNATISDTLKCNFDLENDVIEEIYTEQSKVDLWGIVDTYTSKEQAEVLRKRYIENKTYREISAESDASLDWGRQIEQAGLRKLRMGKAKRKLLEKLEVVEASMYCSGKANFDRHNFTSKVENIVMLRVELQEEYGRRLKGHLEYRGQKRTCL